MQNVTMQISLTLKGPILTQSSNPGELGLDMVVARHQDTDKTPYLPGTLIAGKLRQALEELESVVTQDQKRQADWFKPKLDIWLGQRSENAFPKTKRLHFSDFDLRDDSKAKLGTNLIRDRVTIEKETGAVKPQNIVTIENPFVSGVKYTFTGDLHFFSPKGEIDSVLKHVRTGFNWFSQLGAMKSVGFGQVDKVDFGRLKKISINAPTINPAVAPKHIGLAIKPRFSFCLSGKPVADNLFESETIIPGGAIIGSIATTWSHLLGLHNGQIGADAERMELRNNFNQLRITHAFPATVKNVRPVVPPISLTKIDDNVLYDVARLSQPSLINNEPPDFALDWKDTAETLKEYPWPYIRMKEWGWPALNSELRVRTAIDRDDYRSKKGELFAYEQIMPEDKQWCATLDLSRIEDNDVRGKLLIQLESLLRQGVIGLGKTKTPADVIFDRAGKSKPFFDSNTQPIDGLWIVTLQTDGLIGNHELLDENSGQNELREMYRAAWDELSSGDLELIRYFARQKLAGSRYHKAVFQKQRKKYHPWLLTEAGSVFVLKARNDEKVAQDIVARWLEQGLPLTDSVCRYYAIDDSAEEWRKCPFIPQNGYGEITVNVDAGAVTTVLTDGQTDIVTPIEQVTDTSGDSRKN